MNLEELVKICRDAGRRPYVVADGASGAVAVAGLEGRIFYVHDGKVASLFRPESATNFSNSKNGYFNPGGDGLWPAPEGTCFGYEYASGAWRVPMGLVNAQYEVTALSADHLAMSAEVDLVNNRQTGIPVRFIREVTVRSEGGKTLLDQMDAIEYIGARPLQEDEFLLAPWSLSQFRVTPDARAALSTLEMAVLNGALDARAAFGAFPGAIRDLYDDSAPYRRTRGDRVELAPNDAHRLQLALPAEARFLELVLPQEKLRITRTGEALDPGLRGADIADADPAVPPREAVRYSIYNDPSGFMELEIVGGCKAPLCPGTVLRMRNHTCIAGI